MSTTVVIIGFYGSKLRHVEKYATALAEIPGVKRTILNECSGTLSSLTVGSFRDARNIVKEINEDKKVVFHVLSNRGMFVYLLTVRLLPKDVQIAGVVFDSCESEMWHIDW